MTKGHKNREASKITKPIIIDNGTAFSRVGFAGETHPRFIIRTIIGYPTYQSIMADEEYYIPEYYIGEEALNLRGVLKVLYPLEHGVIFDWDSMEKFWRTSINHLQVNLLEHPILLIEPPLNPAQNREKIAELFFETLNVPALCFRMSAFLSLYALRKDTGLVVDIGEDCTRIVPVCNGFPVIHTCERFEIGGRDISLQFRHTLNMRGIRISNYLNTELKERLCYVALDFDREKRRFKHQHREKQYMLPSGEVITIEEERLTAPEILFNPSEYYQFQNKVISEDYSSLDALIHKSIQNCNKKWHSILYENIVLTGGSSLFPGLKQRLEKEIIRKTTNKVNILTPQQRQILAWMGGTIIADRPEFSKFWITKDEYEEYGSIIVKDNANYCPFCGEKALETVWEGNSSQKVMKCFICQNRIY
ncbi:MAG: actin, cytoplasmic 2 [Candidatus Hodarchaeota archaeon]